jgi:membrane protein YdbS with pleckstrin-like domain
MKQFENIPPEFEAVKDDYEDIYWTGRPLLIPFLATGIPFLVIGIIWGVITFSFFSDGFMFNAFMFDGFMTMFIIFYLFPFYGSILNMLRLVLVYQNTYYAYTNKRLMLRTGFFGTDFKTIDYDKIQNIEVNVNPLERMLHVGTIKVNTGEVGRSKNGTYSIYTKFIGIENPYEVFKQIKQVSLDIKTDWKFPNDMRPKNNPGYQSTYKK